MTALLFNCLCVGAGGFIGSILRYLLGFLAPANQTGFPLITFIINVIGAFAIAFISTYFIRDLDVNNHILLFLRVGLCGGFTTFSAFTLESFQLIQKGDITLAALYMAASCLTCLVFAFIGHTAAIHAG